MQQVAQSWLIYDLTGSAFLVGLNGLIRTVPFLAMSLYAGTVADRVDRKKLLFWAEAVMLLLTLGMAALVGSGLVQVWHIYAFSVITALVGAFEIPTHQALLPHLVPRQDLLTAVSLNSLVRKGSQVIGPSLGGLSVAAFGVAETYFINVAGYAVLLVTIVLMRATNPPSEESAENPLQAVVDGLRYVRSDVVIGTLLALEAAVSIFGSYNTMLVIFARDVFENGPEGLGLLQSAPGLGTILGSMALSIVGDIRQKGRVMLAGGVVYGLSVALFAFTPWFPLALLFLAISGAADVVMGATRTTVLQLFSRKDMLGRVMSLHAMSTRGLGPLGGFQSGWLGSVIGVPPAVAIGGAICIASVLAVAWAVPAVRDFTGDDRDDVLTASNTPQRDTTPVSGLPS